MSLSVLKAASSCLRYLMAVQNHLLSNTVLIKPDENEDSDSSLQGETLKVQVNTKLYFKDAFSTAAKLLYIVKFPVLFNCGEKCEAAHCFGWLHVCDSHDVLPYALVVSVPLFLFVLQEL